MLKYRCFYHYVSHGHLNILLWILSDIGVGVMFHEFRQSPHRSFKLLNSIILKFISPVLLNQLGNIFQYWSSSTGSVLWNIIPVELSLYFPVHSSRAGRILENIAPAARAIRRTGHDRIPAQTQSTGLKYKPKDQNTISSVYQSLNLPKSGHWIENKDHQRMMFDPMLLIVQSLWSFLTAVTTTAVAPIAVIFTCIYLNLPVIA